MILFRTKPHGTEYLAEVVEESSKGELYVELENGTKRWIPADWVEEED